eukprot:4941792-Pleurochrysis_carterae.AAC.1
MPGSSASRSSPIRRTRSHSLHHCHTLKPERHDGLATSLTPLMLLASFATGIIGQACMGRHRDAVDSL